MTAKILNLDKISAKRPKRELVINGKTHEVKPMTVKNFVETTRDAERLEKEASGHADQAEATIAMIVRAIPTLTPEQLAEFDLEELGQIANFVRGQDPEEDEKEAAEEAGKQ